MNELLHEYHASGPTMAAFHASDAFVKVIIGPVGSSKSSGCTNDIFGRAIAQAPGRDGVRRTRWAIVRNTYRELKDTTLATWMYWMRRFGDINYQDMVWRGGFDDVEFEVLFRALDSMDDVGRLLSLELTGAWLNEAREIPRGLWLPLEDRVGRFPSIADGGATWRGITADSNPPDQDHWFFKEFEENRLHEKFPDKYAYFKQAGGLVEQTAGEFVENPLAENTENLEPHYYLTRAQGKPVDHIRVYYCAQYGYVRDGKPVVPEFVDSAHTAKHFFAPTPGVPVVVGIDFGLTPAAAFLQRDAKGAWSAVDELVAEDMGIRRFGEHMRSKMAADFPPGTVFRMWGDPAGGQRSSHSLNEDDTVFSILRALGIQISPAVTPGPNPNDFNLRREALAAPMLRMIDGEPGFKVSPKCKYLRKGLSGGYCYRRIKLAGDEKFADVPDKNNPYSHICEAAGYALIGAGEGRSLITRPSGNGSGRIIIPTAPRYGARR